MHVRPHLHICGGICGGRGGAVLCPPPSHYLCNSVDASQGAFVFTREKDALANGGKLRDQIDSVVYASVDSTLLTPCERTRSPLQAWYHQVALWAADSAVESRQAGVMATLN